MENNISLIITMHNQKDLLDVCIKWLDEVKGINKVILIDNGSEDGTSDILPSFGYDYIIFDEGKQGDGIVWNAAIDNFKLDDVIVFMDIRYVIGRNALLKLSETVQKGQNVGVVGPVSNGFRGCQYISIDSLDNMLEMEIKNERLEKSCQYPVAVGIDAGIWAISSRLIKENGKFNERLVEAENVLIDYELNMIQKGYRAVVCSDAIVFDLYFGVGNNGVKEINNTNDRGVLKKNWDMNYFNRVPNSFLTELINEDKDAEFSVLEVGCDLGATLLDIQSKYPNSKPRGMEINSSAVKIAKYFLDVREGNIEENVPFQEKFDYIIFGDVLEHLHDPQKTIKFCKDKLLKKHGCIIASIPNIMHISVMQQLLSGRFEYKDMGLLDKTHIHFFTYYEILIMFQNEGFSMEEVKTTMVKLTEEQESLKDKLMEISQNVATHMYDTYQYVVKARS